VPRKPREPCHASDVMNTKYTQVGVVEIHCDVCHLTVMKEIPAQMSLLLFLTVVCTECFNLAHFFTAGLLCLVPVSWSANTIVSNFYNPLILSSQRRELGAALYLGWAAAIMMMLGGGLLCWNCPDKEDVPHYATRYLPPKSRASSREYV